MTSLQPITVNRITSSQASVKQILFKFIAATHTSYFKMDCFTCTHYIVWDRHVWLNKKHFHSFCAQNNWMPNWRHPFQAIRKKKIKLKFFLKIKLTEGDFGMVTKIASKPDCGFFYSNCIFIPKCVGVILIEFEDLNVILH